MRTVSCGYPRSLLRKLAGARSPCERAIAQRLCSELRLLAYPQPGCTQRLTTWKKNARCVLPARVRGANQYSLRVCTRWRSLKPCARHGERSILREAPQGRSDKMWSGSPFAGKWLGAVATIPSVAPHKCKHSGASKKIVKGELPLSFT